MPEMTALAYCHRSNLPHLHVGVGVGGCGCGWVQVWVTILAYCGSVHG